MGGLMRFGLGPYSLAYEGGDSVAAYQAMREQAQAAEEVGFDSVWMAEHHFTPEGFCPAPSVVAAALAAWTTKLRIGLCSTITLAHPIRIAEDVAVLDCLSNGRVIFCPATGYREEEFRTFGVTMKDKGARFREALAIILKAWSPGPFAYDGRHWKLPEKESQSRHHILKIDVTPKPVQLPPPIWLAAFGDVGVKRAARLGYPWLASPLETLTQLKRKHDLYRQTAEAAGQQPSQGYPFPVIREVYVAESDERAQVEAAPGLLHLYKRYRAIGLVASGEGGLDAYIRERCIVGGVARCILAIQRYRDELGVDYIICRMAFPGMAHDKVLKSIRLFGQEVIPQCGEAQRRA